MERFVALDVEIASRSPLRVCAIGAARFDSGREAGSYESRVHVDGPIHFSSIHGLRAVDLANAPAWPAVWSGLLEMLGDVRLLVAFRASFDRAALLTMCARHGIRLPRFRFACAAAMIEARVGHKLDLCSALESLGLPFPGRPHDPLSDARAAGAIAIACTRLTCAPARH